MNSDPFRILLGAERAELSLAAPSLLYGYNLATLAAKLDWPSKLFYTVTRSSPVEAFSTSLAF
jgi:hypothetical protein